MATFSLLLLSVVSYPWFREKLRSTKAYSVIDDRTPELECLQEVSEISLTAPGDRHLLGMGWAATYPEYTLALGKVAEFHFHTFFPQVPKRIVFDCDPFHKLEDQMMTVVVNGRNLVCLDLRLSQKTYSVDLPATCQEMYRNHVTLLFDKVGRPIDYGINNWDKRPMAARFRSIRIHPLDAHPAAVDDDSDSIVPDSGPEEKVAKKMAHALVLALNTGVCRQIVVKPRAHLKVRYAATDSGPPGTFSVYLENENGMHSLLEETPTQSAETARIDLSDYSDYLADLWLVYEGQIEETRASTPSLQVRAELHDANAAKPLPNILLISIDTLRADHLGCYGAPLNTPHIDALADRGVLFRHAYSHIPITLPSHTTLFTSQLPHETCSLNNGWAIADDLIMLPEMLRDLGFFTSATVSLASLSQPTNFSQGFDIYTDPSDTFEGLFLTADEVNRRFFQVVDGLPQDKPWFLFLHYSDPHLPYHAHGRYQNMVSVSLNADDLGKINVADEKYWVAQARLQPGANHLTLQSEANFILRKMAVLPQGDRKGPVRLDVPTDDVCGRVLETCRIPISNPGEDPLEVTLKLAISESPCLADIKENYSREVEFVDTHLGQALGYLEDRDLLSDALVVFTADHGESLGEHQHIGHITQLYNTQTHVPLIVCYGDRVPAGVTTHTRVSLADVVPTIFELTGMDSRNSFSGRSLVSAFSGRESDRSMLGMTFAPEAPDNLVAWTSGEYKIIRNLKTNSEELFDISTDHAELHDVADTDPDTRQRMQQDLDAILDHEAFLDVIDPYQAALDLLDEEWEQKLRGLGYIH